MRFCPKCGTRMKLVKAKGEKASFMFMCPKCGYQMEAEGGHAVPLKKAAHSPQELIVVIGKEEQKLRTLPTMKIKCPKCGNNLAYVWQVQTRGIDESSTQFFRCTKCGYTFREYS